LREEKTIRMKIRIERGDEIPRVTFGRFRRTFGTD